ncbi:MAG: hypothetical protein AAGC56_14700 [Pseudomonadota bacterium]
MMVIFNVLVGVFAVILIVVGALAAFTPIPFGILFIAIGLVLLSTVAPPVRHWLKGVRRRWKWLNRQLRRLQKSAPAWIGDALRKSDPDPDEPDETEDDAGETDRTRAAAR